MQVLLPEADPVTREDHLTVKLSFKAPPEHTPATAIALFHTLVEDGVNPDEAIHRAMDNWPQEEDAAPDTEGHELELHALGGQL